MLTAAIFIAAYAVIIVAHLRLAGAFTLLARAVATHVRHPAALLVALAIDFGDHLAAAPP